MWLLHARTDLLRRRDARRGPSGLAELRHQRPDGRDRARRGGDPRTHERQHLPLRRVREHRRRARPDRRMREFEYIRAGDAMTAVAEIGDGAKFLGGGTNLVDLMKLGVEAPARRVDVRRLPGTIDDTGDGGLRIDASV